MTSPYGHLSREYSDEAKRASDAVNLALLADKEGNVRRWIAIRLSDGGSDGIVYDNVADAANHQLHYQMCMYIQIQYGGMSPKEADVMLRYHRQVYDAGNRPPYLDGAVLIFSNN
jgi:hypothetical protein